MVCEAEILMVTGTNNQPFAKAVFALLRMCKVTAWVQRAEHLGITNKSTFVKQQDGF